MGFGDNKSSLSSTDLLDGERLLFLLLKWNKPSAHEKVMSLNMRRILSSQRGKENTREEGDDRRKGGEGMTT